MNTGIYFFTLLLAPFFAQSQILDNCAWSSVAEKMVINTSASDAPILAEDFKVCSALNKYLQSLISETNIRKSTYADILLGPAQAKTSALRVLWILDQYRDDYVNASKTAKYSVVLDLFEKGMTAYFDKLEVLNKKHIAALTSNNAQDVMDWQYLGQIYQDEVSFAESDWISSGYKNETYQLAAKAQQTK